MKQIIAIGGGGFGRTIKDLKIEKYIKSHLVNQTQKFVSYQQQPEMIRVILKIFIKLLMTWLQNIAY